MSAPTTIERAFTLATSGECGTVEQIIKALRREGFSAVEAHLAGRTIRQQLRDICSRARSMQDA
jgi:tRNA G26 N,N-dimethylase Trm1